LPHAQLHLLAFLRADDAHAQRPLGGTVLKRVAVEGLGQFGIGLLTSVRSPMEA
jgi:hypothetical protein